MITNLLAQIGFGLLNPPALAGMIEKITGTTEG
jgi:hypothetical protein